MLYSRSTEYAIRALIHLAQVPQGGYAMAKNIAEQENIPAPFLAKILQQLAHIGLLRSVKGPHGGFGLNMPAEEIRLIDIVEVLDGLEGHALPDAVTADCPDGLYCTRHAEWMELKKEIVDYLKAHTIAELADSLEAKRTLLARRAKRRAKGK
jgi:Rrf2 family transcriptional regulator, iron-sulfur cluster assembly transcription factor